LQHQGNLEPKNEQFFGTNRANMALELMANGTENTFNEQSVEKSSNDPNFKLSTEDTKNRKQVFYKISSEYRSRCLF
jgi:hypothetical protein